MITKTLDAPMTGKVIFEADVNTGTVTHKTNRSLFTISPEGATGQIPLLLTSYGYFRSRKYHPRRIRCFGIRWTLKISGCM